MGKIIGMQSFEPSGVWYIWAAVAIFRPDRTGDNRELRQENQVDEAVADGFQDAVAGAEANAGDPGSIGT